MAYSKDVAVLDVGSEKLTVFIGERTVNGTFNVKGMGEAAYEGFKGGEWLDPDGLYDAVERACSAATRGLQGKFKKLYVGVPGEFTAVVTKEVGFAFDKTKKIRDCDLDELFKTGDTYADNPRFTTINCSAIYYILDGNRRLIEPRGLVSSKLRALLSYVLCERSFTQKFDDILRKLGFLEVEYISACWAESMLLFEAEQRDKSAILVDVGFITSNVMLVRGDGLLHLSSFSCGGGNIAADLNMCLDIPYVQANLIRQKLNLSVLPSEGEQYSLLTRSGEVSYSMLEVNEVARGRVEYIAKAIRKCLDRCEYECPSYLPIYVTGGGLANIRGTREILSSVLDRQVEFIAPADPQLNSSHLSTTLGILDVALKSEKKITFLQKIFGKF